jgi:hypothetical protein
MVEASVSALRRVSEYTLTGVNDNTGILDRIYTISRIYKMFIL